MEIVGVLEDESGNCRRMEVEIAGVPEDGSGNCLCAGGGWKWKLLVYRRMAM
jgi:hypothetical protein